VDLYEALVEEAERRKISLQMAVREATLLWLKAGEASPSQIE
jgi:hypothetical protein